MRRPFLPCQRSIFARGQLKTSRTLYGPCAFVERGTILPTKTIVRCLAATSFHSWVCRPCPPAKLGCCSRLKSGCSLLSQSTVKGTGSVGFREKCANFATYRRLNSTSQRE